MGEEIGKEPGIWLGKNQSRMELGDCWGNPLDRTVDIRKLLGSIMPNETDGRKQSNLEDFKSPSVKKKYTQNWPAYDKAKTNQDILFKSLLQELLFLAIEEDKPRRGRKAYSTRNRIFCMAVKVFYRSDLRKCQSMLKEFKRLNYIQKVPCFKSIDNFFNDERLSKILDDLIFITALPLASLETTGAIDSTGFALRRFEQWSTYKWGKHTGKERLWRKAHAILGCTTNIFLGVTMTKKNVADCKMFEDVVGNKPKYFAMDNFVADKAYSSRAIVEFIHNLGLQPYIPFRSNTSGKARGSMLWAQLFLKFLNEKEEYMRKYHKRSNVETGFHMLKTRFGDHLMTKTFTANTNEVKIKFLCHNICVLIQEIFERDVDVDFFACVKKIAVCKL